MKLIGHDDGVARMIAKYGPVYFKGKIPKNTYPGVATDTLVAAVAKQTGVTRVTRPSHPFRLVELADLIEQDLAQD